MSILNLAILVLAFFNSRFAFSGDRSFVTISCANTIVWASPVTPNAPPKHNFLAPKNSDGSSDFSAFRGNHNVLFAGTKDKFTLLDKEKNELQIWTESGELVGALGEDLLGSMDPSSITVSMFSEGDFVLLNVVQADGLFKTLVKKSKKDRFRVQNIEICGLFDSCSISRDGRLSFLALKDGNWMMMENKVVSDSQFFKEDVAIPSSSQLLQVSLDSEVHSKKFYSVPAQMGETRSFGASFSRYSHFLLSIGKDQLELYELDKRYFESFKNQDLYFKLKNVMKLERDLLNSISKVSISEKGKYFAFSTTEGFVYVGTSGSYPNSKFNSTPLEAINLGQKKVTALEISESPGLITIVTEDGFLMHYLFNTEGLTNLFERNLNPKRISNVHVQTPELSAPILGQKPGLL